MTAAITQMRMEMKTQIQEGIATGLAEALRRQPLLKETLSHDNSASQWQPHDLDDLYDQPMDTSSSLPSTLTQAIPSSIDMSITRQSSSNIQLSSQNNMDVVKPDTLDDLLCRFFQGDTNARFKSPEQRKMAALAVSRQHNFIGILATGGGKSLIFMLAAIREDGFYTIVLIPNKMLLRDMMRKAEEANIPCMQWTTSSGPPTDKRILFVALETATHKKFLM
jgi:hypothetical protein